MDIDDLTRQPWERQLTETARNFHNFQHYLHLEIYRRSMRQAFTDHQVQCLKKEAAKNLHAPPDWQALRFKFTWPERAEAHDRHLAERQRLQRIAALDAMNERHTLLAQQAIELAANRLKQYLEPGALFPLSPLALVKILDVASTVERRAVGLPSEIVKHQTEGQEGLPLDLSPLSEQELQIFQQLIDKCRQVQPIEAG